MPRILGAACQILQQGVGSAPTCREHGTRLRQLEAKGNGPQRGGDKMQGLGNLFSVQAGRENWGGSEGSPKKVCQEPTVIPCRVWGARVGVLVAFINPANGRVPGNFVKHQGCSSAMEHRTNSLKARGSELVILGFANLT